MLRIPLLSPLQSLCPRLLWRWSRLLLLPRVAKKSRKVAHTQIWRPDDCLPPWYFFGPHGPREQLSESGCKRKSLLRTMHVQEDADAMEPPHTQLYLHAAALGPCFSTLRALGVLGVQYHTAMSWLAVI